MRGAVPVTATNPEPGRSPIPPFGRTDPPGPNHIGRYLPIPEDDEDEAATDLEPAQDLPSRAVRYRPVCSDCGDTGTCPVCRGGGLNEPGLECPACRNTHRCHCLPGPATATNPVPINLTDPFMHRVPKIASSEPSAGTADASGDLGAAIERAIRMECGPGEVLSVADAVSIAAKVAEAALAACDTERSPSHLLAEFHTRPGVDCAQPPAPTLDVPGLDARLRYIREETNELSDAIADGDLIAAADALGDIAYVVYGAAWRMGVDLDAVVVEVHRSNMTKTPSPGDGKAIKGPGYSPPDIAGALAGRTQPVRASRDAEVRQLGAKLIDQNTEAEQLAEQVRQLREQLDEIRQSAIEASERSEP